MPPRLTFATEQRADADGAPRCDDSTTMTMADRLRRYLCAYWLRPENAFWMALRSDVLARQPLSQASIDLSCGDGVFTFIHTGGVFDERFDVFTAVDQLERVRDEHVDMFDHVDETYRPAVRRPARHEIDTGTDLKQSLIEKARRLNLYRRLLEHDNNDPLPFEHESFRTVFCNSCYWVHHIDGFLREIARITQTDGRIILHVKLDSMRGYTLQRHASILGDRFLKTIGRGRLDTWPTLASRTVWEDRFQTAGLVIESATPFITRTHAHIWDVGLRPIAPLLVRMANALGSDTRESIKRDWVDLFCDLLAPICNSGFDPMSGQAEPAEMQYVLTPDARAR